MTEPMLVIRARPLHAGAPISLGPSPYFRIEGMCLIQGPNEAIVGRYSDQYWVVEGRFLSSYECTDRSCVRFSDAQGARSEPLGPFRKLHFPNGCCYADSERLADLIPQIACWQHCRTAERWPALIITPARAY